MCDRCSHSHFHPLHFNNSPCTVNPWPTSTERQGPESSVSFHLSAGVPPPHRGAPGIHSAEHASLFWWRVLPVLAFSLQERWDHPITRHKWRPAADFFQRDLFSRLQCPGIAASSAGRGAAAAEASSVLTAAASGWKCWHLPPPFLHPQPCPVLPPPSGDAAHPGGAETARLNSCSPLSSASPDVFIVMVEGKK